MKGQTMLTTEQPREATLTFTTAKLDILSRALATAEKSLRSEAHKVKNPLDDSRAATPEAEALRRLSNSLHDHADAFHKLLEEIQTELCADAWMQDANGDLL
jgi:hypothetical protein